MPFGTNYRTMDGMDPLTKFSRRGRRAAAALRALVNREQMRPSEVRAALNGLTAAADMAVTTLEAESAAYEARSDLALRQTRELARTVKQTPAPPVDHRPRRSIGARPRAYWERLPAYWE